MNDRLEHLAGRISDFLVRMDLDPDQNDEGMFMLKYGSTVVMVSLFEAGQHTYVRFASTMLTGVQPKLDLVMRLLRLNTEVIFGAFLLFEDNTLSFTHTLLGDAIDFEEFTHAITYVAQVSDNHDDELQALAGGQRAEDILAGEQGQDGEV